MPYVTDGNGLISLPGGGAVSVDFLAQHGNSGYKRNPDGTYTVPDDATFHNMDGTTTPVAQYQWAGQPGAAQTQSPVQNSTANTGASVASATTILHQYGLDDLIPIVDGWIRGGMTWDEAQVALMDRGTDAGKIYDARFPAIRLRQEKGLPPITPAQYVQYESTATEYMHAAGLPSGFYDNHDDFTNLLANDVSLNELNARVTQGFAAVVSAPPQVRQAFQNFFGAQGDGALAAYFLDPDKALPVLAKQVDISKIAGAGIQAGFNLDQSRATQITDTGVSDAQARNAFDNIHQLDPLFQNTISETKSLTAENQGVDAAFSLDQGQAKQDIARRLDERKADFAGGGGAAAGQQGVFGLGTAR